MSSRARRSTSISPPVIAATTRPAPGFDVVAPSRCSAPLKRAAALDADRRRAFALDRRRPSRAGTRRARRRAAPRGVADLGPPVRRGGREQRRLGAGDRRFVEVDRAPAQPDRALRARARAVERHAPIAASASRCVAIVRRAGKSPPGGARCARPAARAADRAAAPSRADRPTSAGSGSSVVTVAQRTRSVVLPMPSTVAPRSSSSRAITSTSLIRGTFVSTHSSVGQQTRRQQRQRGVLVAFDLDAARQPRPPSIMSVAMSAPLIVASKPRYTISSRSSTPNAFADARACTARSDARMSAAVAPPSLTMKLPCVGETRAPPSTRALQPGAIDERAGRPRDARPAPRRAPAPDSERCSRRSASRAAASACETPATRARSRAAPPGSPSVDAEVGRRGGPRASAAGGCGRSRTPSRRLARQTISSVARGRASRVVDELADEPAAEVRVAEDRAADRARRAGPRFEAGHAVADRPPHEAVDRHAGVRANARPASIRATSPPRTRMTSPRTPASATSTFEPPPSIVTGNADCARDVERLADLVAGRGPRPASPPARRP